MSVSTILQATFPKNGMLTNGAEITSVKDGTYGIDDNHKPSIGIPTGFSSTAMMLKTSNQGGNLLILYCDYFGNLALYNNYGHNWKIIVQ